MREIFYIKNNKNIYLTKEQVLQAIKDYYDYMNKNKTFLKLIIGMYYIDLNNNKYFVDTNNNAIKTNKTGNIENLGKGDLFVYGNILYLKKINQNNYIKLAEGGRLEVQNTKVYKTKDGVLIYKDKNGNIVAYDSKNGKAKIYDKETELLIDNKNNIKLKSNGEIVDLGKLQFVLNKTEDLPTSNTKPKIVFEKTKTNIKDTLNKSPLSPTPTEKDTSTNEVAKTKLDENNNKNSDIDNFLNTVNPSRKKGNRSLNFITNADSPSNKQIDTITAQPQQALPPQPTATLEVTKILSDEQISNIQIQRENENVFTSPSYSKITFPPGTTFEGYLLSGVIAPTAPQSNSLVFIKLTKDTFLEKNIHIGTYDGYIIAKATGDLISERVNLTPIRMVFYDNKKKFNSYFEGEINVDTTGTITSLFDGLPGIQGIALTNYDELTKWAMESQILKNIGDFLKNYSNPMGAIMTTNTTGTTSSTGTLSDATKQGAISGFADTVDMIAQYKLDLMKQQMPVVVAKGGENVLSSKVIIRLPASVSVTKLKILE
jgi:hypothetical protein